MIFDALEHARRNISHRKLRSGLTVLGIIIGIMAIVSLIAVSSGLENAISSQLDQLGQDTVIVTPKSFGLGDPTQSPTLTTDDVSAIEGAGAFEYVVPFLIQTGEVKYRGETRNTMVHGIKPRDMNRLFTDSGMDIREGRFIGDMEENAVVVGYRVADSLFSKKISLQNRVIINGRTFTVTGILEPIGSQYDDEAIYMSMDSARTVFNMSRELNTIFIKPRAGEDPNVLVSRISHAIERKRGDKNFEVMTAVQLVGQVQGILSVVQIVLAGIAAISLVVGGIGIMNSMYTSVLERTQEIGLMKAVGARSEDILRFFILESGILGALGGIAGTILGVSVALGVEFAAKSYGFQFIDIIITPRLVALGIGFASIAGAISGAYPAKEAAAMQPIEALRQYV